MKGIFSPYLVGQIEGCVECNNEPRVVGSVQVLNGLEEEGILRCSLLERVVTGKCDDCTDAMQQDSCRIERGVTSAVHFSI